MKEAYLPKQETLLTELRNWKNTENIRGGVYDDEALKSRSFQKLKMQTYQQLYRKYKGTSLSMDEKALHRMLRYQYKQIEHKLYPNALARLGMRGLSAVQRKVEGLIKRKSSQEVFNAAGLASVISSSGPISGVETSVVKEKEQPMENSNPSGGRWVNDLGRKSKAPEKRPRDGDSLGAVENSYITV